jgi:hypothetical protein
MEFTDHLGVRLRREEPAEWVSWLVERLPTTKATSRSPTDRHTDEARGSRLSTVIPNCCGSGVDAPSGRRIEKQVPATIVGG